MNACYSSAPAGSVIEVICAWAVHTPHHLAVADGVTTLDFQSLATAINVTAQRYRAAGIISGDRVGTALPDGAEALISSLAALACGGVHVPLDHHLTTSERMSFIATTQIHWLVDHTGIHELDAPRCADPLGPGASAFLRFTSGTTGDAKGVLLSHRTLRARAAAAARALELTPGHRVLWLLPLAYHWAASVIAALVAGAGIVFGNRLRLRDTLAEAHTHGTTMAYASPWHCQRFAASAAGDLKPLHTIICTTAALTPSIADQLRLHHGIRLRLALGVIECGLPLISAGNQTSDDEPGDVGIPQPGFSCRLRHLTSDGSGELLINGPGLFDAYLDPWTPAQGLLVDGYFCTGDRALIHPDGRVRILGRIKDLINVGGMKVFPQEIEALLASHPAVVACHAYAVADQRLGETVGVTIELIPEVASDAAARDRITHELRAWCRTRLAPLKQPTVWEFAQVARTHSGKARRTGAQITDR